MIRKMKDSDLDQVCELEKKLFSHPWRRIDFNYELTENPFSHYVVEEENGEIVAYLGLWLDENQIQITTLGVNEDYQRQGYAKKLMDYLFDFSQKNKVDTLSLEVRESNFKAINLYEYFHFKKAAIRKNYYSHPDEDGILMICDMKGDFSHENISR
mgnify:FL=1